MIDEDVLKIGMRVTIDDESDCIVPTGDYLISKINEDGSFHVGGMTAIWPHRVVSVK